MASPEPSIGYTLCADGALSINRCDVGRALFTTADAEGKFTGAFAVTPTIDTAEGPIDCGAAPGACFVGAANINDFIENGRAPVSFGPEIGVDEVAVSPEAANITVALSRPSDREVRVHWATADGSATTPTDYASSAGDLVFAPGETTKSITVAIVAGADHEQDREFSVQLSNPQAGSLTPDATQATVTIAGDAKDHHHDCDHHHHHHHRHHDGDQHHDDHHGDHWDRH